jgi:hypothetical protein
MESQREKMLEDWTAIRNAILRAEAGELLVKYMRESDFIVMEGEGGERASEIQRLKDEKKDKIVGIYVDLVLKFPEALDRDFTKEEISDIQSALAVLEKAQQEKKGEE